MSRVTKAVLFDLDGTFADTAPDLAAALNQVRARHDLPPLPLEMLRPQASHGSAGLLRVGFGVEPGSERFDHLRGEFLSYYDAHICERTVLFPGMAELVDELEQHGLAWGIVTNKPHRFTVPLMHALGYAERAACLVSGDTCGHPKPHPDPLLHAANHIGVTTRQCVYVGDDLRDMQAAVAADMPGLVAAWGYIESLENTRQWPAQGSIDHPSQVLQFLENASTSLTM